MGSTATLARTGHARTRALRQSLLLRRVQAKIRIPVPLFKILHRDEEKFNCPLCGYEGPFANFNSYVGVRKHAKCPQCSALERHRLQYLTVKDALNPLSGRGIDICDMPFESGTYDFIFASHVLEHIQDDRRAIKEIRRVLRPNGIAILPVPIVSDKTVEYFKSNPFEEGHVRAPGTDYFERYKEHFGRVEVYGSHSFPAAYQVFVYEDRSKWPSPECPLRPSMQGTKHGDFVPVCYA